MARYGGCHSQDPEPSIPEVSLMLPPTAPFPLAVANLVLRSIILLFPLDKPASVQNLKGLSFPLRIYEFIEPTLVLTYIGISG